MGILESIQGEIGEAADILRPHLNGLPESELRSIGQAMLGERYQKGRWPNDEELKEFLRRSGITLST
jgi:hypothetical protein